jgi:putative hydrolase of the HAD superfamily
LKRLQVEPARSVFVGDHPEIDVRGSRAAGMQAVWRRDSTVSQAVGAVATIENVGDLLPLLGLAPGGQPRPETVPPQRGMA